MMETKNSTTLDQILENAKSVSAEDNQTLTAERFIYALIEAITKASEMHELLDDYELMRSRHIFRRHRVNGDKAKNLILEYIENRKKYTYIDGLYLQKKMLEAKKRSEKQGETELTAYTLLSCILEDPSDAIKIIFNINIDKKQPDAGEQGRKTDSSVYDIFADLGKEKQEKEVVDKELEVDIGEEDSKDPKADINALVESVKNIRNELKKSVFGQDNAINVLTTGFFQANLLSMIDKSRQRPKATFLFAGPPGVGKTLLAEKMAELLKLPFKRFDMSEYVDKEASIEFCGSDNVYKNSKGGNLTEFVSENPECVLLFDEIEKAHINIIHLFLQLLDAGRLRDSNTDKVISFANVIIIMTTNAGRQLYEESENGDLSTVSRKVIIKALQNDVNPGTGAPYFPSAICSRFASGNVVMFNHIMSQDLRSIAQKEIEGQASNLERETGINVQVDDKVYTALLFSEGSKADARTVRGRAETFFNDELYELLRLVASEKVKTDISDIEKIKITVDLANSTDEIKTLFESEKGAKALILADSDVVEECKDKINSCDIIGVQTFDDAINVIKNNDVGFALLDLCCGVPESNFSSLNIEDVDSEARKYFKFIRENGNGMPVYLLENSKYQLSDEEKVSFTSQGVRDILDIKEESFAERIQIITLALHQQKNMNKLARENKIVSFETAQIVSDGGKTAEIKLFDFGMAIAIDAEDKKSVLSAVSKPNVKFDEVIGAGDAKKELKYFVEYLKNPKKYIGSGVKAPRGVLLYGAPGTGKTMLAKAMASESGVTFIAAEGNQFMKQLVGEGPEEVHKIFKIARKYAPSILFIDEIDAIAKERRGASALSGNTEEILTAFLTEMDGFKNDPSRPVFVLAATNFDVEPGGEKSLDPALMRRFDRRIYIELPNKSDRIRFINKKIEDNVALMISAEKVDNIALRATGMSLAELDSVIELALRSAIRDGSTIVTDDILEEAFETFNSGEVKQWDASQLERVARHEAGHALVCCLSGETPSYLTIVARGNHGGYMQHAEQEGKAIFTKNELLAKIRTSLGGRAAEIVYYGEKDGISTGAGGDLISATDIAQRIVCAYGMDDEFGLAVVPGSVAHNGNMSIEVRNAVNKVLNEQMKETIRLISENKDKIDALVDRLMVQNNMTSAEIEETIGMVK